jgi:hypothetical protein
MIVCAVPCCLFSYLFPVYSMLSVFMLSVFMLSVFMLSVFMLSVFMLSVFMLSVFMLSVIVRAHVSVAELFLLRLRVSACVRV